MVIAHLSLNPSKVIHVAFMLNQDACEKPSCVDVSDGQHEELY